jgi:hypothetical protein
VARSSSGCIPTIGTARGEIQSTLVSWLETIGPVPMLVALTVLVGGGIVLTGRTRAR